MLHSCFNSILLCVMSFDNVFDFKYEYKQADTVLHVTTRSCHGWLSCQVVTIVRISCKVVTILTLDQRQVTRCWTEELRGSIIIIIIIIRDNHGKADDSVMTLWMSSKLKPEVGSMFKLKFSTFVTVHKCIYSIYWMCLYVDHLSFSFL